jgi:predicted dithiol-disulfide oxidoreductase (DUF899 family)
MPAGGNTMTETKHAVGTRAEWTAARKALSERETEIANLSREFAEQRQLLDQVPKSRGDAFRMKRHDEYRDA